MSELDFSQGFSKSGQLISQYGGLEPIYDINKKVKIGQADNLVNTLANKYSKINKLLRDKWRNEMLNMEGFEYMNVDFLAAALDLYENNYEENNYEDEEELTVFISAFKNFFKSDNKMDKYYDLLILNKKKLSDDEYLEKKIMTKQFLFTYLIKLFYFRKEGHIISNDNITDSRKPYPSRDL